MKRIKLPLAILCTCLILALCSWLPELSIRIAGGVQNRNSTRRDIPPVWNVSEKKMDIPDKLALLRNNGQRVFVSQSMVKSTPEEIGQAALSYLEPFIRDKTIPPYRVCLEQILEPCMIFDEDGKNYGMFWIVSMLLSQDEEDVNDFSVWGIMDDETLHMLDFSYSIMGTFADEPGEWNGQDAQIRFAELFFEALEIKPVPAERDGTHYVRYVLPDDKHGPICFEIHSMPSGVDILITYES